MDEALHTASSILACDNTIPKTTIESAHCFSASDQLYLTQSLLKKIVSMMTDSENPIYPASRNSGVNQVWQIGAIELYQAFFYEAGERLVPTIVKNIDACGKNVTNYSIIFILITFILSAIIIFSAQHENNLLKFALIQILRCPPTVILNNQKIMDLISGDYSHKNEDNTEKHI
ncbi:hypothetical protein TVAG_052910 [Trichomonas vaginalis G3]|uniref:Uncharacterized protein n=1 Tax=Trichomonas vaginalis (strain ATCC PRA-98 / G3) TaxID=412133 RepID=A2F6K3_TRIV3|nr:guanylate cyclase protein [Trichomonas vaginalis G3]EAX99448.1 hypothetical protein TVAG_052910 [Trichomonas vaginalis G3]KAI5541614.1 guanylate cyclase protein [Trichomonas vaginalis G3]|eukprot:XP_001312378.1 hypothetical protein [Trichomonas vaginalis G3]